MDAYVFRQAWYIPLGLYYYLLAVPRLDASFPFIRLLTSTSNGSYPTLYSYEPVAGLFVGVPSVPLGITAFVAVGLRAMRRGGRRRSRADRPCGCRDRVLPGGGVRGLAVPARRRRMSWTSR